MESPLQVRVLSNLAYDLGLWACPAYAAKQHVGHAAATKHLFVQRKTQTILSRAATRSLQTLVQCELILCLTPPATPRHHFHQIQGT